MLYGLGTHNLDQTLLLFGQPASVTAVTRALRRESKTDDTFTVLLQYTGKQKNLVCTVKTTIVSTLPMDKQLKYLVRGREGTFIKVSTFLLSYLHHSRLTPQTARRRRTNRPPLRGLRSRRSQIRRRAGKLSWRAIHEVSSAAFAKAEG
jgi:predicted dehydrogenase